jgi:hypothetical protein
MKDGKNPQGFVPCSYGCPGVAVFESNFDPPPGFVHIERCDECDRFFGDFEAALSFTQEVYYYCVSCEDLSPIYGSDRADVEIWMDRHEALHPEQGGYQVVVPKIEAHLAGLLPERHPHELFDEEGWDLKVREARIILEDLEGRWMSFVWWAKEKMRRWRSRR